MKHAALAILLVRTAAFAPTVPAARRPAPRPAPRPAADCSIVDVELGDRSYPIYIGEGLLTGGAATAAGYLRPHVGGSQVLVVTNEKLEKLGYLEKTVAALTVEPGLRVETLVLPDNDDEPSEATKTLENLGVITDYAIEKALDRKATFVALGGGVIGDMVGFAAACYVRGVNFIQIPTTLMAMVDSSVGGKTAVNSKKAKNMVGAFYQPVAVVADVGSLQTLPDRELASGVSEVIKYGLIRDAPFFEWLEAGGVERMLARDPASLIKSVEDSCRNKAEVVALDEKEGGVRATLNLGHTFGHAIETKSGYGSWLHGEAIGIGMHMAAAMSRDLGWIDDALYERARDLVRRANVPDRLPEDSPLDVASFEAIMAVDKKVADGELRLILLKGGLGECVFTGDYDRATLRKTLVDFCDAANRTPAGS